MTEEIILVRDDSEIPWGFRLTGGRDFNSPLTVVRITGQSIAEKRGLRAGDIITEINNQKTNNLCHSDAQRFITDGGNFLKLIVLRGSSPVIPPALTPVRGLTPVFQCNFEKKKTTSTISAESVYSLYEDDSFELLDQSGDEFSSEFHEPTEEEINLMLLENAEVIEENGKNVIGVNFKRFIPKCEFIKDSAVFQVLQEEQVHKELSEKEQLQKCPDKRFSTFLAPPDRPVPEPKPKVASNLSNSNSNENTEKEKHEFEEKPNDPSSKNVSENECEESSNAKESDKSENDIQDQKKKDQSIKNVTDDTVDVENETNELSSKEEQELEIENSKESDDRECPKNEFENKLNLIRNTLSSLEQLPSLIQSQIAAIQAQIEQLTQLKDSSLEENTSKENTLHGREENTTSSPDSDNESNVEHSAENDLTEENTESEENPDEIEQEENELEQVCDESENTKQAIENENLQHGENETNEKVIRNKESFNAKEACPKRRPACPLTPLPRPVVLPGGRIWRKPKDAYNEEFIAETLISQAEVLVGSTLGVNFRKYEPPKFDLSNSAVYKLVHNIESKKAGLQDRDTIPSLQDYYQSPISARHFYCANLANKRNDIEADN